MHSEMLLPFVYSNKIPQIIDCQRLKMEDKTILYLCILLGANFGKFMCFPIFSIFHFVKKKRKTLETSIQTTRNSTIEEEGVEEKKMDLGAHRKCIEGEEEKRKGCRPHRQVHMSKLESKKEFHCVTLFAVQLGCHRFYEPLLLICMSVKLHVLGDKQGRPESTTLLT